MFTIKAGRALLGASLSTALLMIILSTPVLATNLLEIWPRISVGEMLTDNLLQQTNSSSGGDAISVVALGGTATVDSRKRTFSLDYATDAQVYARNSGFDEAFQDQYIGLRDNERLSEATTLSASDYFFNGKQMFAQSLIGSSAASPLLSQALAQNTFLTNSFNAQLNHQFSDRLSSWASVHQTFFSTSGGETSESFQQGGELGTYYKVNARLSLGPDLQFNDFRFSNQPRSDSYQPSLAVKWSWSERLTTSGTVGPLITTSATETSVGVGYTLSSSYVGDRWLFQLFSGRTSSITAGNSGSAVYQYGGAGAAYKLSRRTEAYVNGSLNQFSQTSNNYYSIAYGGGINHELTRSISVFGQFVRFQTDSNGVNGNASDTLMFGIKFAPLPWVWSF